MSKSSQIKLKTTSILNVPFQLYEDFTFIVNGKEYKTTQLEAELLSPKIGEMLLCDPTINKLTINTTHKGDFSNILKLVNFEKNSFEESELPFISEIIEFLKNKSIEIESKFSKITESNAIEYIQKYQQNQNFYSKPLSEVINFVSSNFFNFIQNRQDELEKLDVDYLEQIIDNKNLIIKNEDQLLTFINQLYLNDPDYSQLYKCVLFQFVDVASINLFLNVFNFNHLTCEAWKALSERLKQNVKNVIKDSQKEFKSRYNDQYMFNETIIKKNFFIM